MNVKPQAVALLILIGIGALAGVYIAVGAFRAGPQDFTVPTTDGRNFTLSEQRGNVVVLDLFATWCASCGIVENELKKLQPEWNGTPVRIVSVGIDQTETMDDLRAYKERHNLTWTVARDTDHVAEKYNTYEIARVVVFDANGEVVFERSGVTFADEFRKVVAGALAGTRLPLTTVQLSLVGFAMVAGGAAFFSPCAVGLLPAYVVRTVHAGPRRLGRTLTVGGLAALGVLLIFFGVGGLALLAGPALTRFVPFLQPLIGFLLIAFGVLLLARPFSTTLQRIAAPLQSWAYDVQAEHGDKPQAFFAYGIAYGAAAAGCTAPVLLSVLVTAAAYGPLLGSAIVAAYALTGAFLMVVVTLAAATAHGSLAPRLVKYARPIETLSALVLIGGGLFLIWYASRAGTFAFRP